MSTRIPNLHAPHLRFCAHARCIGVFQLFCLPLLSLSLSLFYSPRARYDPNSGRTWWQGWHSPELINLRLRRDGDRFIGWELYEQQGEEQILIGAQYNDPNPSTTPGALPRASGHSSWSPTRHPEWVWHNGAMPCHTRFGKGGKPNYTAFWRGDPNGLLSLEHYLAPPSAEAQGGIPNKGKGKGFKGKGQDKGKGKGKGPSGKGKGKTGNVPKGKGPDNATEDHPNRRQRRDRSQRRQNRRQAAQGS